MPDRAARREAVTGVADERQAVLVERRRDDVGMAQRPHEPEVHLLAEDELEHLLGVAGAHRHAHAGVADAEAPQDRGQHVRRERGRRAEHEAARAASLDGVHDLPSVREVLEGAARRRGGTPRRPPSAASRATCGGRACAWRSFSSRWIRAVRAGCVRWSASAARLTFPRRATSTNAWICAPITIDGSL